MQSPSRAGIRRRSRFASMQADHRSTCRDVHRRPFATALISPWRDYRPARMNDWIRGHHGPIRWRVRDNARSGATPLTSQPQTNPKYQFVNALYSSLALFETTNRVLQLVENTLIASLITQRSLVQIQPPQRNSFVFNDLQELATTRICS